MHVWLSSMLIFLGSLFVFIAALGVVRMPDLFMRMHAATKAGTLGAGLLLSGTAVYFVDWSVSIEVMVTIFFLVLTAPVVSHLIARIAWYKNIHTHPDTRVDL